MEEKLIALIILDKNPLLTLAFTMYSDGCEPIVSNKVASGLTVWYMAICVGVDVSFREAEIDHVDSLFVLSKSDDAVPKLYITM